MTLEGTNTYVVDGYVIDPGPDDAGHLERVREAAGGEIAGVLLTHGHSDHSARRRGAGCGGPVGAGKRGGGDGGDAPGRSSRGPSRRVLTLPRIPRQTPHDREVGPFTVIATPGHAADHVCFVLGDVCFCGDLILGTGSSIVPPAAGGGSLADYMSSLETLARLDLELLAPGHGPWITDPAAKIAEYRRAPPRPRAPPARRARDAASAPAQPCLPRSGTTSPSNCAPRRRSRCRPTSRSSRPRAGSTRPSWLTEPRWRAGATRSSSPTPSRRSCSTPSGS